jgi:FdhD protein
MPDSTRAVARQTWRNGIAASDTDQVVVEVPVAFVYNGISHAVMMSTPADLEDLALGFSLSESILSSKEQLLGLDIIHREQGIELAMEITAEPFAALKQRRRALDGRTGCGLCGVEALQQLSLHTQPVGNRLQLSQQAPQDALAALAEMQDLKAATGGVHGAAWCDAAGTILLLREDVGRHNALDKMLGAVAREELDRDGFALVTSRASYEMVVKAGTCGVEFLAAVSAPTDLAISRAGAAGMTLAGFLQPGRMAVYSGAQRLME